ncbi:MAG: hypothetical protein Unbinned1469contig1000_36 [Prokaryotic dsDNA virus sp.]|jgi:hypothetical protein|nr:MAG: hypothetical protein Unbinned1469contig1000_36 [Prokaryotic dsDNA virus sp.]|tara:strand:+ start:29706 stop:29936 length:231 start_codon:yes stop_codon:yes gene_type:complete
MKIKLPDPLGNEIEIEVDENSLAFWFKNFLKTPHKTKMPHWFRCSGCASRLFYPLQSEDYTLCNVCWTALIGSEVE